MFEMVVVVTVSEYGIVPFSTPLINNLNVPLVPLYFNKVVIVRFPIPPDIEEDCKLPFLITIALLSSVSSVLASVAAQVILLFVHVLVL